MLNITHSHVDVETEFGVTDSYIFMNLYFENDF